MQSIAETCVRFDAAHLSINLVSEIALPMFPTLKVLGSCIANYYRLESAISDPQVNSLLTLYAPLTSIDVI